jgi:hypothetical protein
VANHVKSERARKKRERAWHFQTLGSCTASEDTESSSHEPIITAIERMLPDAELRVTFQLMAKGERRTVAFARELRLSHLPVQQQKLQVKRVKDRLMKYLRRSNLARQLAENALR